MSAICVRLSERALTVLLLPLPARSAVVLWTAQNAESDYDYNITL